MSKTISTQDLLEKYGGEISFLFKGVEPFMEKDGMPLGVLIEKDDKVLCNECGEWRERLGGHVNKAHKMTVPQYKEKWGFNPNAPLCSKKLSEKLREGTVEFQKKYPWHREVAHAALLKGRQTMRKEGKRGSIKRMQEYNKRSACPEQMKQRLLLMMEKFGKNVSLTTIRKYDPGLDSYGRRHAGTFNKWKKSLGFEVDTRSERKSDADLIHDLRSYVSDHNSLPWDSYTKKALNNFPHSMSPYIERWGSISRACQSTGIYTSGWNNWSGKGKSKRWGIFQ